MSPKLTTARYLTRIPWLLISAIVFGVLGVFVSSWFYAGVIVVAVILIWQLWLIPQQVKRLGWLETSDELLITKGKLWHTFTVVPYGRIQFVDVTAGPLERAFGMKQVQLHTASASSDSTIQGLPAAEADALRERLAVKARERMSGL
ncbi:transmembrane protein, distant homology with ydbS [Corynebacterium glutamicum]|nr:transmembrane protein, distant homology with ydbS [Corynebacterium glutamicum]